MKFRLTLILFSLTTILMAQNDELPFAEIPPAPEGYTAGNILARMVDGLGYRYYWASEGLTEKDLDYRPSEDARTTMETLVHLYGLSETIVNAPKKVVNKRPVDYSDMNYEQLRSKTLANLMEARTLLLGKEPAVIASFKISFEFSGNTNDFPFWNMLNGPIADAIYHTGQIVSFRRSSGNPMNPNVNVFSGKNRQ